LNKEKSLRNVKKNQLQGAAPGEGGGGHKKKLHHQKESRENKYMIPMEITISYRPENRNYHIATTKDGEGGSIQSR